MSSKSMWTWYWIWPPHVTLYHLYTGILAYVSGADVTHTLSWSFCLIGDVFIRAAVMCVYVLTGFDICLKFKLFHLYDKQIEQKRMVIGGDLPFHSTFFPSLSLSLVILCSLLVHLFLSALIRMMSSLQNHRDLWKWCSSHCWTCHRCFKSLNITDPTRATSNTKPSFTFFKSSTFF